MKNQSNHLDSTDEECCSSLSPPPSPSGEEEEKTIPFLRRLVEMLQENEDIISFYPGDKDKNCLGKIVVHDRLRIETEVLPRYFNHASFASLRRQLNYFNFARIGRSRQRGATYINDGVVLLDDILRLKRREVGSPPAAVDLHTTQNRGSKRPISSMHSPVFPKRCKSDDKPLVPPKQSDDCRPIALDLTLPQHKQPTNNSTADIIIQNKSYSNQHKPQQERERGSNATTRHEELFACNVLLTLGCR